MLRTRNYVTFVVLQYTKLLVYCFVQRKGFRNSPFFNAIIFFIVESCTTKYFVVVLQ